MAAADAIGLLAADADGGERWAIAAATVEAARPLFETVAAWVAPGAASEQAEAGVDAAREAAEILLDKGPTLSDQRVLDRLLPWFVTHRAYGDAADALVGHVDRLVASALRSPATVTELRATAIACGVIAETVVVHLAADRAVSRDINGAAASTAWRKVHELVRPLVDTSPERGRPTMIVNASLGIASVVRSNGSDHREEWQHAIAYAAMRLPEVAASLRNAPRAWGNGRTSAAYACDLPHQQGRTVEYLAGRVPSAVIIPTYTDLWHIQTGLATARTFSVDLAATASRSLPVPGLRRSVAAYRSAASSSDHVVERERAQHAMRIAALAQPAARRSR